MKLSDMLFANAMMGEGGGGGGGGSSPFKTAQVTIQGDRGNSFAVSCDYGNGSGYTSALYYNSEFLYYLSYEGGDAITATLCWAGDSVDLSTYVVTSITGDATYNSDSRKVTISGDCTITGYIDD